MHVFTLCRVFPMSVLSLVYNLEATAGSYKALKLIFTIKETRLCEYTNKHAQVNLFFKFFVTVKLIQASTFKVMNNQLFNNQKL